MRLFDTYTKSLVELPEPPGPVRMYFCGPTVYARAHVGNARPFVVGMWLRSWLRSRGYEAVLVHNITDVNDKIYEAAPGASAELAERATAWYLEDTGDLGLGMPDYLPRVTDHIPGIVRFIEQLVERGFAYPVDGDVYFRVARFPEYGRLSGQRPDEVEQQEPNPLKEDGRDFALWKANKPGEDTAWDAPWGRGRPGWHIECSAMAEELLGESFEIHGGGLDLAFPHHENELAQSRALGHGFARIWAHNGLLEFTGAKMSKSVATSHRSARCSTSGGARRCSSSSSAGTGASRSISRTRRWRRRPPRLRGFVTCSAAVSHPAPEDAWQRFAAALEDDFNTPAALASCTSGAITSCSNGRSASSGSDRSRSMIMHRRRSPRSRSAGSKRELPATSRPPTGCVTRSRPPAGRCATSRAAYALVRKR